MSKKDIKKIYVDKYGLDLWNLGVADFLFIDCEANGDYKRDKKTGKVEYVILPPKKKKKKQDKKKK